VDAAESKSGRGGGVTRRAGGMFNDMLSAEMRCYRQLYLDATVDHVIAHYQARC
jgi:hypothetical protein